MCPHSLAHGDPQCKNGGRLHANNGTQPDLERYNNCVQCDCPPGWAGIDCSRELPSLSASKSPHITKFARAHHNSIWERQGVCMPRMALGELQRL